LNGVSTPDASSLHDFAQHSSAPAEFFLQSRPDPIHARARCTRLGNCKHCLSDLQLLPRPQLVQRQAERGDILSHFAVRNPKQRERLCIH
jgi:hypothetical protein